MTVTRSLVLVRKIPCFLNLNFHIKDCGAKQKSYKGQRTQQAPMTCKFGASVLSHFFSTTRSIPSPPSSSLPRTFVSHSTILILQGHCIASNSSSCTSFCFYIKPECLIWHTNSAMLFLVLIYFQVCPFLSEWDQNTWMRLYLEMGFLKM